MIYGGTGNVAAGSTLTGSAVAQQINLYSGQTGVTASVGTNGALTLSNADGSNISVTQDVTLGTAATGTGAGTTLANTTAGSAEATMP